MLHSTFSGIFQNLEHSPESSRAFPGIINNIPRNLLKHSPDSLIKFPGIFSNISRNAKMRTLPGILLEIPRNPSEHSPRSLYSPHSVPRSRIPDFMNSLKQGVAGANFAPLSYNICIIKANMLYIDRHLLTRNLIK